MIYIATFVYLFACAAYHDVCKVRSERGRYVNLVFAFVLLVLMAALRYRVGADSLAYQFFLENEVRPLQELTFTHIFHSRFEPAWVLLSSLSLEFGGYYLLQGITALIAIGAAFLLFVKASKTVFVCILFFYVTFYHYFSMEVLRESLAVSMFIFSILLVGKSKALSLFFVGLAVLFHKYALVLIPLYFFLVVRMDYRLKLKVLVFITILLSLVSDLVGKIQYALSFLVSINLEAYNVPVSLGLGGYAYYLIKIVVCLGLFILHLRLRESADRNEMREVFYVILFLFCSVFLLRVSSFAYVERFANYFILFVIVFNANVMEEYFRMFGRPLRLFGFILIVLLVGGYSWLPNLLVNSETGIANYSRYYPYYSILSERRDGLREYLILIEAKEVPYAPH